MFPCCNFPQAQADERAKKLKEDLERKRKEAYELERKQLKQVQVDFTFLCMAQVRTVFSKVVVGALSGWWI